MSEGPDAADGSNWLEKSIDKAKADYGEYVTEVQAKKTIVHDMALYAKKQAKEAATRKKLKTFVAKEHAKRAKLEADFEKFHPASLVEDPIATKLCEIVAEVIAADPYPFDGLQWAARPQEWWCKQAEVSVATLRRRISAPPFVREWAQIDGKVHTLIRTGDLLPMSHYGVAKRMAALWRRHVGEHPTPDEFGCMCGLAEVWPSEKQLDILAAVLGNWKGFMAGAKLKMALLEEAGDEVIWRYYDFPTLTFVRKFHQIGLELWMMEVQAGEN